MWAYKELDFAPHLVVGLVLHVRNMETFSQALGFNSSLSHQCRVHVSHLYRTEMTMDVQFELNPMLMELLRQMAISAIAEAILMRISAKQVPSLHRVAQKHLKLVTSSHFWPFLLISTLMLFVLLVINLLFFC